MNKIKCQFGLLMALLLFFFITPGMLNASIHGSAWKSVDVICTTNGIKVDCSSSDLAIFGEMGKTAKDHLDKGFKEFVYFENNQLNGIFSETKVKPGRVFIFTAQDKEIYLEKQLKDVVQVEEYVEDEMEKVIAINLTFFALVLLGLYFTGYHAYKKNFKTALVIFWGSFLLFINLNADEVSSVFVISYAACFVAIYFLMGLCVSRFQPTDVLLILIVGAILSIFGLMDFSMGPPLTSSLFMGYYEATDISMIFFQHLAVVYVVILLLVVMVTYYVSHKSHPFE